MTMRILMIAAFLVSAFTGISAQERFLKPVDEAGKDASFAAFRTKLLAAVRSKDAKFIRSIVDPKIAIGFGGDSGAAAFYKHWKQLSAAGGFWKECLIVISNGGTFSTEGGTKQFWAPYTFSSFPVDLDGFEHAAILGTNVRLRSAPGADADIVAELSYNLVKFDESGSSQSEGAISAAEWIKVRTLGGKIGYIKSEYVRSPIDYRAGFEKKRGVWKMTAFIAGD